MAPTVDDADFDVNFTSRDYEWGVIHQANKVHDGIADGRCPTTAKTEPHIRSPIPL